MDTITWEDFSKEFSAYDLNLPIEAWGSLRKDTPAQVTYLGESRPEAPVEEWPIVLDLAHGLDSSPQVSLEDSDFGWDDDGRTVSQVIADIDADLALESSAQVSFGVEDNLTWSKLVSEYVEAGIL